MDVCARHVRERTNLKSVLDGELALGSLGGGLNLSGGVDLNLIRSVRHPTHELFRPQVTVRLKDMRTFRF